MQVREPSGRREDNISQSPRGACYAWNDGRCSIPSACLSMFAQGVEATTRGLLASSRKREAGQVGDFPRVVSQWLQDQWTLMIVCGWDGWVTKVYMDTAIPFSLRSAPKIFTALADALQWVLEQHGLKLPHYLDNFLIFGAPNTTQGKQELKQTLLG